jgi:predicted flap endonuclease-1-like 5' DNA nuclease
MLGTIAKDFLFGRVAPALQAQQEAAGPWWAWLLLIIVIIACLVLIWWRWRSKKQGDAPASKAKPAAAKAPQQPATAAPAKPDDLAIIEGIGPKIASTLQAAGITTFAQLAAADVSKLDKILKDAGLRLADASTWAEQAKLAADGKMDELKKLQDSLKGGRRV